MQSEIALMKLISPEPSLSSTAARASMSEPTARKYRRNHKLPSQCKPERTWRTRNDPFSEVWAEVEVLLERDQSIEAKTIFDYLCRKYEGRFSELQLRTLQRRVKLWRATKGAPPD